MMFDSQGLFSQRHLFIVSSLALICCWAALPAQAEEVAARSYCPFDVTGGAIEEDRNDAVDGAYADAEGICNEACPDFTGGSVSCSGVSQGGKNMYECIAEGSCDGEGLPTPQEQVRGYCPFRVTGGAIEEDRNAAVDGAYADAESICNEACPDFSGGSVSCTGVTQGGKNAYECIARGVCDGEGLPSSKSEG